MPRYKLTIEYDGMPYYGWQRQEGLPSVQSAMEGALRQFTQEVVTVFAAGRTDSGVHALGQVVHIDLNKAWNPEKIIEAMNGILRLNDHPICVLDALEVGPDFDARFSATQRYYQYRIINRIAPLTVAHERAWWVRFPLDVEKMQDAAQFFLGKHDFSTFRSTDCQAKSPIRTIESFQVYVDRSAPLMQGTAIHFDVSARAFLHSQVRSMVGSLKMIGDGKWTKDDLIAAAAARDRKACGVVAPPYGLYLTKVDY